jgi:MerR family transcriptional regulator, Zn(II)-responsive regulator of zntA
MMKMLPAIPRNRTPANVGSSELYSIIQLARAVDEPAHVIRYYCRIGLLVPQRRGANGYRRFDAQALRHLHFIRRAQGLGFSLNEIAEIFQHARNERSPCPSVREIIDRRTAQIAGQLENLVALHERMRRALRRWRRMPDRTPTGGDICHLIETSDAPSVQSGRKR